jgi:hypothetical protein
MCDHPFALMRMNVFMRDLNGWCESNQPSLVGWASIDRFRQIMEAVETADVKGQSRQIWDRQARFLLSGPGTAYMDRLYAKRDNDLRPEMESHQWHLRNGNEVA